MAYRELDGVDHADRMQHHDRILRFQNEFVPIVDTIIDPDRPTQSHAELRRQVQT